MRIGHRLSTTLIVFAPDDREPLLGAYTLEAFLLAVDAANRRLVPVSGLLKQTPSVTAWSCRSETAADAVSGKVRSVFRGV